MSLVTAATATSFHPEELLTVPDEFRFPSKPHSQGVVRERMTARFYPVEGFQLWKPGQRINFRIPGDNTYLDPSTLRFHYTIQTPNVSFKKKGALADGGYGVPTYSVTAAGMTVNTTRRVTTVGGNDIILTSAGATSLTINSTHPHNALEPPTQPLDYVLDSSYTNVGIPIAQWAVSGVPEGWYNVTMPADKLAWSTPTPAQFQTSNAKNGTYNFVTVGGNEYTLTVTGGNVTGITELKQWKIEPNNTAQTISPVGQNFQLSYTPNWPGSTTASHTWAIASGTPADGTYDVLTAGGNHFTVTIASGAISGTPVLQPIRYHERNGPQTVTGVVGEGSTLTYTPPLYGSHRFSVQVGPTNNVLRTYTLNSTVAKAETYIVHGICGLGAIGVAITAADRVSLFGASAVVTLTTGSRARVESKDTISFQQRMKSGHSVIDRLAVGINGQQTVTVLHKYNRTAAIMERLTKNADGTPSYGTVETKSLRALADSNATLHLHRCIDSGAIAAVAPTDFVNFTTGAAPAGMTPGTWTLNTVGGNQIQVTVTNATTLTASLLTDGIGETVQLQTFANQWPNTHIAWRVNGTSRLCSSTMVRPTLGQGDAAIGQFQTWNPRLSKTHSLRNYDDSTYGSYDVSFYRNTHSASQEEAMVQESSTEVENGSATWKRRFAIRPKNHTFFDVPRLFYGQAVGSFDFNITLADADDMLYLYAENEKAEAGMEPAISLGNRGLYLDCLVRTGASTTQEVTLAVGYGTQLVNLSMSEVIAGLNGAIANGIAGISPLNTCSNGIELALEENRVFINVTPRRDYTYPYIEAIRSETVASGQVFSWNGVLNGTNYDAETGLTNRNAWVVSMRATNPVSFRANSGLQTGDEYPDEEISWDYEIRDVYMTCDLVDVHPAYTEAYMKKINAPEGLAIPMSSFMHRKVPLNYSGSRNSYRLLQSLTAVNAIFTYWTGDQYKRHYAFWSDVPVDLNSSNPGGYQRPLNAGQSEYETRGLINRYPDKLGICPWFGQSRYNYIINGIPVTNDSIACGRKGTSGTIESTEALAELARCMFWHKTSPVQPPVSLHTYNSMTAANDAFFVLGLPLRRNNFRSGRAIKHLELLIDWDNPAFPAPFNNINGAGNKHIINRFRDTHFLIHHDEMWYLRDKRELIVVK